MTDRLGAPALRRMQVAYPANLCFFQCELFLCDQAISSDTSPAIMGSVVETMNGHIKQCLDRNVYENIIDG